MEIEREMAKYGLPEIKKEELAKLENLNPQSRFEFQLKYIEYEFISMTITFFAKLAFVIAF
jgi:hypothetical protein